MRGLALVGLLLLAMLSLTSTFALQNATISGTGSTIAVVNTNTAILALAPGATGTTGNASKTAYYKSDPTPDTLLLDFRKGRSFSASYGFAARDSQATALQKNVYEYRSLFSITNNSDTSQCVAVYASSGSVPDLGSIKVGGSIVATSGGAYSSCVNLGAGSSANVDIRWEITSTSPSAGALFVLRVETSS